MQSAEAIIVEVIETNKQFDTVVVGLGKTGFACARYLAAQGINFAVTDNRDEPPMLQELKAALPDVPLYLGSFDESLLPESQAINRPSVVMNNTMERAFFINRPV